MKNITFIALNDIILETDLGEVTYKKGSNVFLESDQEDDVFISYHEADGNQVFTFELDVTTLPMLEGLLNNLVLVEEELDERVSYKNVSLDQLVLDEGLSIEQVANYLTEVSYKKKTVVRQGKKTIINVPIKTRKKILSPKQKAALKQTTMKLARNPQAKRARIKSMKIRSRLGLGESCFLALDYMLNEDKKFICNETIKTLKSSLKERAKIFITENTDIRVRLLQADKNEVLESLKIANINYFIEELEDSLLIKIVQPIVESVVKPYFSDDDKDLQEKVKKAKKEIDDEEDMDGDNIDGDDMDGEDNSDNGDECSDDEDDLEEKKAKKGKK